jgi:hypothetical protein
VCTNVHINLFHFLSTHMAISSASSPCAASFASRLNLTKALLLEQDCARVKKQKGKKKRGPSLFEQRLQWDSFVSKHAGRPDLHRHLRMTLQDFNLVLSVIKKRLEVNVRMAKKRGGAHSPRTVPLRNFEVSCWWFLFRHQVFHWNLKRVAVSGNMEVHEGYH